MHRLNACIFLTALLLALSACGGEHAPDPLPDSSEDPPSQEDDEPPQEEAGGEMTVYNCGGIQVALPNRCLDLLTVQTEFSESPSDGWTPLISVSETASMKAAESDWGDSSGMGFLFGFDTVDQTFFEQVLREGGGTGFEIFAKDKDGLYYARTFPTDVRFYRSDSSLTGGESEDLETWEDLNALAPEVQADLIARNGLTPYTVQEFYDQEFTYDGEHAYINYYPNYAQDGTREEFYTLVLSQPVRQGDGGIWCVERMTDQDDRTYVWFPDASMPSAEYYAALQDECDAGKQENLLTPLGAAERFVEESYWFLHTPNTENFQELDRLPSSGN